MFLLVGNNTRLLFSFSCVCVCVFFDERIETFSLTNVISGVRHSKLGNYSLRWIKCVCLSWDILTRRLCHERVNGLGWCYVIFMLILIINDELKLNKKM